MLFAISLHVCVCPLGTGEGDVKDAEKLLQPYLKKYPKVLDHQFRVTSDKSQNTHILLIPNSLH